MKKIKVKKFTLYSTLVLLILLSTILAIYYFSGFSQVNIDGDIKYYSNREWTHQKTKDFEAISPRGDLKIRNGGISFESKYVEATLNLSLYDSEMPFGNAFQWYFAELNSYTPFTSYRNEISSIKELFPDEVISLDCSEYTSTKLICRFMSNKNQSQSYTNMPNLENKIFEKKFRIGKFTDSTISLAIDKSDLDSEIIFQTQNLILGLIHP